MSFAVKLERVITKLDRILEFLAVCLLVISVLLAFIGVILRYQFNISFEILTEVSTYSIVYAVFLYLGPLIKQDGHIKMSLLENILKGKSIAVINILIDLLMFLAFIFLTKASLSWTSSLLEMKTKTLSGGMLMVIPAFAVVLGMILGLIYTLFCIVKETLSLRN